MKRKKLYGKNVFVTGASSGIGRACARMFAGNGYNVTGVSRNTEECVEEFPGGGTLTLKRLDVTEETAVRKFVEDLPGVDIAILCAGMGVAGPAETTSSELTRKQMEVNYFGTLNAAQPCLTKMRRQRKGLLLVIGSIAGRVSIPMQSQYSASKYALEAFTDAVRMEMKPFGIDVSMIEPGAIKTDWGLIAADHLRDSSEGTPYEHDAGNWSNTMRHFYESNLLSKPSVITRQILRAVESRRPKARYRKGRLSGAIIFFHWLLPARWWDGLMRGAAKMNFAK